MPRKRLNFGRSPKSSDAGSTSSAAAPSTSSDGPCCTKDQQQTMFGVSGVTGCLASYMAGMEISTRGSMPLLTPEPTLSATIRETRLRTRGRSETRIEGSLSPLKLQMPEGQWERRPNPRVPIPSPPRARSETRLEATTALLRSQFPRPGRQRRPATRSSSTPPPSPPNPATQ